MREEDFWDDNQDVVISAIDEAKVHHLWLHRRFMKPRNLIHAAEIIVAVALVLGILVHWLLPGSYSSSTQPLKGAILFTYHDQTGVDDSLWTPDSRYLAFIDQNAAVYLWNATTRKVTKVFTLPPLYIAFTQMSEWMWAPDHIHLIFATISGSIQIRNIMTGQLDFAYDTHSSGWPIVGESPNGNYFAVSGTNGIVQIWNIKTGKKLLKLASLHVMPLSEIVFSPNSQYIATVSANSMVEIWDITTGKVFQSLDDPALQLQSIQQCCVDLSIVWAPDSIYIASIRNVSSGAGNSIVIWNALTGHKLVTFSGHTRGVFTLQWSPDSIRILSASVNEAFVWDAVTGHTILSVPGDGSSGELPLLSPDGKLLETENEFTTLEIWDAIAGHKLFTYQVKRTFLAGEVISWAPDGSYIVSAITDGSVLLCNALTGEPTYEYSFDSNPTLTLNWSPDGRMMSTTSSDGIVAVLQAP